MREPAANALAALLCLSALSSSGCSLPAFIHDKTIGPISPAGHVHAATVGGEISVSENGVEARSAGGWWFRPYPEDFLRRVGLPRTFWFTAKGIQAFFYGVSPLVIRDYVAARELPTAALSTLTPLEATSAEVLTRLGPPTLWIKRREGSVMSYRADKGQVIALWLGTPPFVDIVPGANNLSFRYLYRRTRPYKTTLFFDAEGRLLGIADNTARMNGEEVEE